LERTVASGAKGAAGNRAAAALAATRTRLQQGDFRVGDRFVVTVRQDSVRSDTVDVRDSLRVSVLNLPELRLAGVLRAELDEQMSAYTFKMLGFVVVGSRKLPDVLSRCLMLIPAALLAALVFNSSFTDGQSYALDERAIGLGVAIIVAWRKMPLIVVVILGAATTAFLRAL
jgi:branched-subunit amino acid transport protein